MIIASKISENEGVRVDPSGVVWYKKGPAHV
jgi:hypothetical protein